VTTQTAEIRSELMTIKQMLLLGGSGSAGLLNAGGEAPRLALPPTTSSSSSAGGAACSSSADHPRVEALGTPKNPQNGTAGMLVPFAMQNVQARVWF
jgi:hypothetical protein